MRVDDKTFAVVAKSAPLIAIDLILRSPDGTVFVGLRNNEPAKGVYFVPGGRVRKNEALDHAFQRILAAETGLAATRSNARFVGVYEHFYSTNRFGDPTYGTHYVVLGYELTLATRPVISLDSQHSEYRWLSEDALLSASDVHENTKAYFRR
jgi:colanic acid biosynthesis protein WcaH